MIVVSIIQFVCRVIIEILIVGSDAWKTVIGNFLLLIICVIISAKSGLYRLQRSINKKNRFLVPLLGFMCVVVLFMLLQKKIFYAVKIEYFIFSVPAIMIVLFMIVKLYKAQTAVADMQKEIKLVEKTQESYNDLLVKVRLRQHGLKNHLSAICSTHYTYKTYEKLVRAQEEYCEKLISENKYNSLLLLGEPVLTGYLFGKFEEIEADGIVIEYTINDKVEKCQVPTYYLVEMLGILLDNAAEALKYRDNKIIALEISRTKAGYSFTIRNPYEYVPFEDIAEWFMLERSEKGRGRGLGLYRLKCLCDEWNCNIVCRNIEIDYKNWIMFTLEINKADDR